VCVRCVCVCVCVCVRCMCVCVCVWCVWCVWCVCVCVCVCECECGVCVCVTYSSVALPIHFALPDSRYVRFTAQSVSSPNSCLGFDQNRRGLLSAGFDCAFVARFLRVSVCGCGCVLLDVGVALKPTAQTMILLRVLTTSSGCGAPGSVQCSRMFSTRRPSSRRACERAPR
jgi:hypothetical protein